MSTGSRSTADSRGLAPARVLIIASMVPNLVAWVWAGRLTVEVAREEYTRFQSIPQGVALVGVVVATTVAIGWLAVSLWKGRRGRFVTSYGIANVLLWAASLTLGFVTSRLTY